MTKQKEKLLNDTLETAINIGFGLVPIDQIEDIFAKNIMVIGTALEEKYTSLEGLRGLIRMQYEQSRGMDLNFTRKEVYRNVTAQESIAIIVEDIWLDITVNNESTGFGMRGSAVLEFNSEKWKMIHWHVSKPDNVNSEVDTFGIQEWKQKADALEKLVAERTADLVVKNDELLGVIAELKSTQSQLIQSEKMASLGELTAGIAHEIQNPLNFVNNFSEVNTELIEELKTEKLKPKSERDEQLEVELLNDIAANEQKINHHGKRADAIVKGMLQHSRSTNSTKELTDINKLADEYLRLAYHGLRAKDKSFNATLKTDFDESIGNINIIPQDIGRVILNLITNAFYVVDEKKKACQAELVEAVYDPTVSISTKKINDRIEISVSDNGNGIPSSIKEKIFQPFFTTKPTGQGTGLGLSLSYDIVKAHAGELKVETKEGEGTTFIIQLPVV